MSNPITPVPARAPTSDRLRGVALGIGIPLGVFGAHRFYVGKIGTGLLQLCTLGGMGLWWMYDMILIVAGEFRDSDGHRLSAWSRDDLRASAHRSLLGSVSAEDLDAVHGELRELAERVDFMERMLAQVRDRPRVESGPER